MFDGRTHLNSSHIETILSLLSIISFSNSVDELDDELNVKDEDEKGDLFLFSRLDLEFFLFSLMERFLLSLGLMKGNIFSFSLTFILLTC